MVGSRVKSNAASAPSAGGRVGVDQVEDRGAVQLGDLLIDVELAQQRFDGRCGHADHRMTSSGRWLPGSAPVAGSRAIAGVPRQATDVIRTVRADQPAVALTAGSLEPCRRMT
jgi:hypothetical protein